MGKDNSNKKELSPEQGQALFRILKARFEKNPDRHKEINWAEVQARLEADPGKVCGR